MLAKLVREVRRSTLQGEKPLQCYTQFVAIRLADGSLSAETYIIAINRWSVGFYRPSHPQVLSLQSNMCCCLLSGFTEYC